MNLSELYGFHLKKMRAGVVGIEDVPSTLHILLSCELCGKSSLNVMLLNTDNQDQVVAIRDNLENLIQGVVDHNRQCECGGAFNMLGYIHTTGAWALDENSKDFKWYAYNREIHKHPARREIILVGLYAPSCQKFRVYKVRRYKKGKKRGMIRELKLDKDISSDETGEFRAQSSWNIYTGPVDISEEES